MGAIIEVKYYNSFWAKKIKNVVDATPAPRNATASGTDVTTLNVTDTSDLKTGLIVQNATTPFSVSNVYITEIVDATTFNVNKAVTVVSGEGLRFGPFVEFSDFPKQFIDNPHDDSEDWYIEESRIRSGYNNTTVDFGVKAHAVDEVKRGEVRKNALIYSGVYNSRTGINNTNQFSVGQDITKGVDPAYGSIQLLYAEDSNLIVFQEDKVSRALIDKDAIYSAEGGGTVTSANVVIGQIVPYAGEFGISTEPESFAVYGYRKYFTDRKRNAVLRLSRDGIEEISRYGMTDWWRDELSSLGETGTIVGGYDIYSKKYDVSILPHGQFRNLTPSAELQEINPYKTLSFDESTKGWISFYTYAPDFIASLQNNFYSFKRGEVYKHYVGSKNRFYDNSEPSKVTFIFNPNVSMVKTFKTINYEGDGDWKASISTELDSAVNINEYVPATDLTSAEANWIASNSFAKKENKYFANLLNNSNQRQGEVVFGNAISGIKGFWAEVTFSNGSSSYRELFAVSTQYVESSY